MNHKYKTFHLYIEGYGNGSTMSYKLHTPTKIIQEKINESTCSCSQAKIVELYVLSPTKVALPPMMKCKNRNVSTGPHYPF